MLKTVISMWKYRKQFISLLVGVPSYEKYVAHMKQYHPNEHVLSRKQFFAEAQEARFNAKGGKVSRCC
ncbi:YbdD/YjiX family protein [Bacillus cereus group sp. BfR-BA-01380]|uniref:YbdD/YjiX family protein n=1 Tax=Bacillus cereus group sp. BfR-BA-01380 TaxID=2920324 RepID=UPI001F59A766|nr:YbdD/YjiX family protein [Bacillus cereus group sp. BfR-BA-01380]